MLKPYNRAELSFQLDQEIGNEGQNSRVFLAHDPQLNAQLVIKQMEKASFDDKDEYFSESSILHFSGHPNVVPIHYACEDADNVYLAMPYYPNGSLNQMMQTRFLTVREIIKFASHFLSALHHIHSKKLIHFDVKPDNILVCDKGQALLSDFGLARRLAPNGLAGQDRNYIKMLPPEAFSTEEFSLSFDIYQAGMTLYRMCVGNNEFYRQFNSYGDLTTFNREQFKFDVRNGRFPSRSDFPEHIPQAIINTIKKCLEVDPNQRYRSALEVVNAIAEIDDHLLDWEYSIKPDGSRCWQKVTEEKVIDFSVDANSNSLAFKTIRSSGNKQRINNYCVESINKAQIKAFLREF